MDYKTTTKTNGGRAPARTGFRTAILCAAVLSIIGTGTARAKVGLSSQFVDVVFEGLKPGRSYNIRELRGVPYTVKNRGDSPAAIIVEPALPHPKEVQAPYEAIPDPEWIKLSPNTMRIGPGEMGFSDIIITIPDDPKLEGKHFMVMLWAHTVGGGFFQTGVKSRVRFSIGPGPKTLERERQRKAMVQLNFDLWPSVMYIKDVEAGKRFDVKRKTKKVFKITNRNPDKIKLVPKAIGWPTSSVPRGYERITDLSWVSFKPKKLKVKGYRVKDLRMILDPPESLKGKKIAFVVQLCLPIGTPISAGNRVFVTIK